MPISELRCEYLTNPLGIDTDRPRFSWEIEDPRRQVTQTAYRLRVASTREALDGGNADLWDTGRVESDETLHIEYQGRPLAAGSAYFWKVQVWTTVPNSQESDMGRSEPARFSLGLLKASDWTAKWITAPVWLEESPMHVGYMSLPAGEVESAKWIQIDLGARKSFDGIQLNPAAGISRNSYSGDTPPGAEFPVRFEITVSDDESMAPCSIVADYTKEGVGNPGSNAMTIRVPVCQGRYVRLTSHLKPKTVFKLAGMEVLQGDVDLAKGCKATALDSFEAVADGFGISLLTAGKTGYDGGIRRKLRPSPLLRGQFVCKKPVRRAIAYATALGNYQLHINGTRVESFLAPGYTEYEKRVLVQAYDITSLLQAGANVAGAVLADGWYRSRYRLDVFDQFKDFAQGRFGEAIPRFLLQVQVDYEDGTREISGTDETWRSTMEGPYRKTSMYDGVIYDAQREIPLWDQPAFQDAAWESAVVSEPACMPYLSPQMVQPIACRGEFKPVSITPTAAGTWICDFGQGVGGVCRVTLAGVAGTKVKLRHAMALNDDGSLFTKNLIGAHDNGDVYILAGRGPQTFTPDFTFHGFRYVEVSGISSAEEIVEISALMIADSCPISGTIETSEARLNKLWEVVSMKHFWIAPKMGGDPKWAKASYRSVRGLIETSWRTNDGALTLSVTIPSNTTATIFVPGCEGSVITEGGQPAERSEGVKFLRHEPGTAVYAVASGTYEFLSIP